MNALAKPPRIFLSAAEPSADLHAASLIQAIRALQPGARFCGVAGPRMQQAGCESIYDMTEHSSMLLGALGHVHHGYRMLGLCRRELTHRPFDAAVVVDSPILNLPVAKLAKAQKVPVLYYIAPQVWAWAGKARIARVRARVDRVACILPFEEPYFRSYGIEAHYVGHPLFAALAAQEPDLAEVARRRSGDAPILAVLPGSRRHVAAENYPGQLQVARALRQHFPDLAVLVSVANEQVRPVIEAESAGGDLPLELLTGQNATMLAAADLALVVSGTATLEAAYHHTPMIVMYNSSRIYQLVRWLINTRYFSLPNILANRMLVPEFMPYYTSTEPIVQRALELLRDRQARQRMSSDLAQLVQPFVRTTASQTTAKIVLDMIELHHQNGGEAAASAGPAFRSPCSQGAPHPLDSGSPPVFCHPFRRPAAFPG